SSAAEWPTTGSYGHRKSALLESAAPTPTSTPLILPPDFSRSFMSKVAVLRTSPETVVEDYGRLMDLAGYRETLSPTAQTCLRINISWHVYMPACSTTPWQMHGVIDKLKRDGVDVSKDLIAAQNDTVVVSCREGTVNNHLAPVLEHYNVPIQYLSEPPTEWIRYEPKGKMLVLDRVYEKQGIQIPKMLIGKNVIHMPT